MQNKDSSRTGSKRLVKYIIIACIVTLLSFVILYVNHSSKCKKYDNLVSEIKAGNEAEALRLLDEYSKDDDWSINEVPERLTSKFIRGTSEDDSFYLIQYAVKYCPNLVVSMVEDFGADVTVRDKQSDSTVMLLNLKNFSYPGRFDMAGYLMSLKQSHDMFHVNKNGESAWEFAACVFESDPDWTRESCIDFLSSYSNGFQVITNDKVYLVNPIIWASSVNNIEGVEYLVENNISDVDYQVTYNGQTALMVAAAQGNMEICKYLLSNGADKNIIDNKRDKKTAYDYAVDAGNLDIALMIEEW